MLSAFLVEEWRLSKMKTIRKGAIVKYCGDRKEFVETWGELFEVYHKEGNFLKLISLKKPYFDVCASVPCKDCKLVEKQKRGDLMEREIVKIGSVELYEDEVRKMYEEKKYNL